MLEPVNITGWRYGWVFGRRVIFRSTGAHDATRPTVAERN